MDKNNIIFLGIFFAGIIVGFSISETDIAIFSGNSDKIVIGISKWVENDDQNLNILNFKKEIDNWNTQGKEIEYIIKTAKSSPERQKEIIQEFIDRDVDLIYSLTTSGTLIAKSMTNDIPIVFSVVTYPVEAGIITSLENSGNNLVGTRNYVPMKLQMDVINDVVNLKSIGFVHREGEPNSEIQFYEMDSIAKEYEIRVIKLSADSVNQIENIIENKINQIDAFYLSCDSLIQSGGDIEVIRLANQYKKPVLTCNKDAISKGALIGNVAEIDKIGILAGIKATYILEGVKPSSINTETQRGEFIIINSQVAKNLGIEIPEGIMKRASIIYEGYEM